MSIPFPLVNAYMAATTEILGVVLLILGLFTRLISIPLIVVMIVAIATVHFSHCRTRLSGIQADHPPDDSFYCQGNDLE